MYGLYMYACIFIHRYACVHVYRKLLNIYFKKFHAILRFMISSKKICAGNFRTFETFYNENKVIYVCMYACINHYLILLMHT